VQFAALPGALPGVRVVVVVGLLGKVRWWLSDVVPHDYTRGRPRWQRLPSVDSSAKMQLTTVPVLEDGTVFAVFGQVRWWHSHS